jgi:hypothetical protein
VDDVSKYVITAIRDMSQEGFIASSLQRSGWKVIYRATSPLALKEKLPELPEALILTSDDFGEIERADMHRLISLRGRSQPSASQSSLDPKSDLEVAEIIRAHSSQTVSTHIPATHAKVTTFASIGGRTGTTTLAISAADYLSQQGSSVLLIEGNRIYPKIASHFQLHKVREEIARTEFGFSIREVSDLHGLLALSREANSFDEIVLDIGPVAFAQGTGRRVEDQLAAWSNNSHETLFITARDDEQSKNGISAFIQGQKTQRQMLDLTILLQPRKLLNRREQQRLISERSDFHGVSVDIVSRDSRAIEKMEQTHSTLTHTSPKSLLLRDIARLLERGRYS